MVKASMIPNDNRKIVDLKKVQWAEYFYENQEGLGKREKPSGPTVRGMPVGKEIAHYHLDYPGETMIERARRLDILDKWKPVCVMQLQANRTLRFVGEKAIKMFKAYQARIYGKKTKS